MCQSAIKKWVLVTSRRNPDNFAVSNRNKVEDCKMSNSRLPSIINWSRHKEQTYHLSNKSLFSLVNLNYRMSGLRSWWDFPYRKANMAAVKRQPRPSGRSEQRTKTLPHVTTEVKSELSWSSLYKNYPHPVHGDKWMCHRFCLQVFRHE